VALDRSVNAASENHVVDVRAAGRAEISLRQRRGRALRIGDVVEPLE
jgi:hypothetical protein